MQFRTITNALIATFAVMAAGVVTAADLPEGWSLPTVAHEGTRVMTADGQTIESRYRYAPPGKQREEMSHEGMSMAIILRQDLGVVWTILPGNMYMEMALDEADDNGPSAPSAEGIVEFEELGKEEVNGWPTTRYRVVTMEDGEEADGYFWITEHWIPVRMEITLRDSPGEKVIMNIRDLRIRDQDPALFEVPPGATNMSSMGGINLPF
ncbi:MAG: DUF4412 domain-containing protein [Gammaproteobacteria bacterium]